MDHHDELINEIAPDLLTVLARRFICYLTATTIKHKILNRSMVDLHERYG
jgi:hypothetical protein